jgi:plastocyanin
MNRLLIRGAVAAALVAAAACGGDKSAGPSPAPDASTTITITASGASPKNIVVPRGSQVTFVNNDGSVHQMYSNPHPEHTDCPEFDSVGQLTPGATRRTQNLTTPRVCGFHDHLNPNNAGLNGSVTIQ